MPQVLRISLFVAFGLAATVAAALGVGFLLRERPVPTLYVGGDIVTMDAAGTVAEALLTDGRTIRAVGQEAALRAQAGDGVRVVDLGGRAMLPGFIDAHGHFPGAGFSVLHVDLNSPPIGGVETIADLVGRLRRRAETTGAGDWVMGVGYDDTLLAEKRHPTREDLDAATTDHPVAILHVSGHLASVNSRGLEVLGVDAKTMDPVGGLIQRGEDGRPNGVLEEEAAAGVLDLLFDPGLTDIWRLLSAANSLYLAAGVTTAQNGLATMKHISSLAWASRLGLLDLRLILWPDADAADALLAGDFALPKGDPAWVHAGAIKLVADGSIQGYTGYLREPYHVPPGPDPSYRGYPRMPPDELVERVVRYHEAGFQLAVHGNGDAAIDEILDAFEEAERRHPRPDARSIIIHAQMARDDQLDRMKQLGVIPSFFSLHTYYWGDRHREVFLGPQRAARISPTKSAEDRDLRFTVHCDTPVVPMEPLRAVWATVNRRTASGKDLGADQRVSTLRALGAVTSDAAYQHFEEASKGSLEAGKLADLVILSASPLDDPTTIDRIVVEETIIDGITRYAAP